MAGSLQGIKWFMLFTKKLLEVGKFVNKLNSLIIITFICPLLFYGSTITGLLCHLQVPVVSYIIRYSLKLKASDADTVHFIEQA